MAARSAWRSAPIGNNAARRAGRAAGTAGQWAARVVLADVIAAAAAEHPFRMGQLAKAG